LAYSGQEWDIKLETIIIFRKTEEQGDVLGGRKDRENKC
jgi:hypothetical protein